ncbi:energy transducer TonB [Myxococcota bacterium]|nr:energy transducer TonB [Myxococcota bacterium]MBU1410676.1 energy transducer TonB [Myxococcota bacterium]MBU1509476.1 energy transducer TonB [Myxococcota bacterium]
MKSGIEVTVFLDDQMVSSRWFPLPSDVQVGDSHCFDVFCPLLDIQEISDSHREQLTSDGYLLKPVRGVLSVGARLFETDRHGRVRIHLPVGLRARIGERTVSSENSAVQDLSLPFSGELDGAGQWRLRFSAYEAPVTSSLNRMPAFGFFSQSLLFGFVALLGLLGLGFLAPREFIWDPGASVSHRRMAILQFIPQQKKPPKLEDDPVVSRLKELRVAPRRMIDKTPRRPPAIRKKTYQLRSRPSKNAFHIGSSKEPIDLTDTDGAPSEPDGPPTLEEPGSSVPILPAPPAMVHSPARPAPRVVKAIPSKLAVPPKRLSFPQVDYPEGAKHLGLEGKVKLKLVIDRTGKVIRVEVLAGLHPLLDRAAAAAARSARYDPAKDAQGRPMESTATVTVRFELEEE